MADRLARYDNGRSNHEKRDTAQALVGPETEHQIANRGVGRQALTAFDRCDESGSGQKLEALIDAGEEFRRHDLTLDSPELHAFSLLLGRTQLARWIDFRSDTATRILCDRGGVRLGKLMLHFADSRDRNLHDVWFVVGGARGERRGKQYGDDGPRAGGTSACSHHSPTSRPIGAVQPAPFHLSLPSSGLMIIGSAPAASARPRPLRFGKRWLISALCLRRPERCWRSSSSSQRARPEPL